MKISIMAFMGLFVGGAFACGIYGELILIV